MSSPATLRKTAAVTVAAKPILELRDVKISYITRAGRIDVVPALSFSLAKGEALGLVGESGCGKSTVAYAIMKYLGGAGRITNGQILFNGQDMASMSEDQLRQIRGSKLAMVYQDPMSSLNPTMRIGRQLEEVPMLHMKVGREEARQRAIRFLGEVNLPDPELIMERYPHQLSGGQQQRVVIAMALMAEPDLLVMDEPTTGLDVTVEAAVLDLVAQLRHKHDTAIIFISHNLGTVLRVCDRVGVMYFGELVEEGPIKEVFANPRHPYTRGLLDSIPTMGADKHSRRLSPIAGQVPSALARPVGCGFASRCSFCEPATCTTVPIPTIAIPGEARHQAKCVRLSELPPHRRFQVVPGEATAEIAKSGETVLGIDHLYKIYRPSGTIFDSKPAEVRALTDIELSAERGRTLAIVGESGCGKSSLAKVLTGIEVATQGKVKLIDWEIGHVPVEKRNQAQKKSIQMVFQNPDSTLNPSHTVGFAIRRALQRLRGISASQAKTQAAELLRLVNLPMEFVNRRPRQLSGGQKQRVAIARALAGDPALIIADEPVSALDVSVQAAIINLLIDLQDKRDATLVFISHDLSVVRFLADHVAVMYLGRVVEYGTVEQVYAPPYHPYTEALLSAAPVAEVGKERERIILEGTIPSATKQIPGCPFASRCPRKIGSICDDQPPPEHVTQQGHRIACHIPLGDLAKLNTRAAE
ncbi:MAG: ABC transporter ATP-binding protein [Rhodospirillaceae bacterium]|nr:MAG: ABC transporter ATP-binding protein [Rhodospirillaceae bacterium]